MENCLIIFTDLPAVVKSGDSEGETAVNAYLFLRWMDGGLIGGFHDLLKRNSQFRTALKRSIYLADNRFLPELPAGGNGRSES